MSIPALMTFASFKGDWASYEKALDALFRIDIAAGLVFRGDRVACRRNPETDGRWFAFWHLIQEGEIEADRLPALRRCERLPWIKYVVENWNLDGDIQWWENTRKKERSVLLWYREEYLVILSRRSGYWLLKSAYDTTQTHRIVSLRRERDRFHGV